MKAVVIAIAGHSGAGKSTLIKCLVEKLGDANSLTLDQYTASSFYPTAEKWLEDGADPNEFKIPQFDADVLALAQGRSITHPDTGMDVQPARFLVLEEHFGRGRDTLRDVIDFVILVDTPLEVSYVRKLSRKTDFLPWEDNPDVFIQNLRGNIEWYLRVGRRFYLAVSKRVRTNCDLIVDGLRPTDEIVDQIMAVLNQRS